MTVFMKSTGRSGLGRRKAGTSRAWKKLIQHATLPSDEYLGVRAGTPAERKRDRDEQMIIDAELLAEQEALLRGFGGSDTTEAYVRRNDGGIARKTKVF